MVGLEGSLRVFLTLLAILCLSGLAVHGVIYQHEPLKNTETFGLPCLFCEVWDTEEHMAQQGMRSIAPHEREQGIHEMDAGATYKERINLEDTHDTQTNLFNDESPNRGDDMADRGHTVGEEGTLHIEANDGDHVGGTKESLDRGPPDTESHNDR